MSPVAVTWLNQFSSQPLNDRQRLALVYLRSNEQLTNSDYRRLNRVDALAAYRELRGLVQTELVEQHGVGRGTYYTLRVPTTIDLAQPARSDEQKILTYVRQYGSINNAECRALLGVKSTRARYLLQRLRDQGLLLQIGQRSGARYALP